MTIINYDIPITIERHTAPPITCAPWCEQGDGHPDEVFVEDQTCWGTDARIETADGEIIATLHRRAGGTTHVYICIETTDDSPAAQLRVSPAYFRRWLAMAEKNILTVLDETGGAEL